MKRNRYMFCLLAGAFLMYLAVPRFSIFTTGAEQIFTLSWLGLAFLVILGNLAAILYAPKTKTSKPKANNSKKRIHYYG